MADQQVTVSEQEAIELLAFLVTSARGLVSEPQDYGPMRLLEATRRLSRLILPEASDQARPLLTRLIEEIQVWHSERRRNPEGYVAFMDECCRGIASELKRRDRAGGGNDE